MLPHSPHSLPSPILSTGMTHTHSWWQISHLSSTTAYDMVYSLREWDCGGRGVFHGHDLLKHHHGLDLGQFCLGIDQWLSVRLAAILKQHLKNLLPRGRFRHVALVVSATEQLAETEAAGYPRGLLEATP